MIRCVGCPREEPAQDITWTRVGVNVELMTLSDYLCTDCQRRLAMEDLALLLDLRTVVRERIRLRLTDAMMREGVQ